VKLTILRSKILLIRLDVQGLMSNALLSFKGFYSAYYLRSLAWKFTRIYTFFCVEKSCHVKSHRMHSNQLLRNSKPLLKNVTKSKIVLLTALQACTRLPTNFVGKLHTCIQWDYVVGAFFYCDLVDIQVSYMHFMI